MLHSKLGFTTQFAFWGFNIQAAQLTFYLCKNL